nr:MAG TPA: hypothetical protein [Caudoviricetes sp.]
MRKYINCEYLHIYASIFVQYYTCAIYTSRGIMRIVEKRPYFRAPPPR